MKLADALMARAGCAQRMESLRQRMARNAKVQEGSAPAEDTPELLEEFERTAVEMLTLVCAINRTNAKTPMEPGRTLSDALAEREILKVRHAEYRRLAEAATPSMERYSHTELRYQSTVDVRDIQRRADAIGKSCRELDARIQQRNWEVDLIE